MASGVVRAATSSTQRTTGCSADRICGRPSTLAPTVATISPHLTLGHLPGQRAGPEVVRFLNVARRTETSVQSRDVFGVTKLYPTVRQSRDGAQPVARPPWWHGVPAGGANPRFS